MPELLTEQWLGRLIQSAKRFAIPPSSAEVAEAHEEAVWRILSEHYAPEFAGNLGTFMRRHAEQIREAIHWNPICPRCGLSRLETSGCTNRSVSIPGSEVPVPAILFGYERIWEPNGWVLTIDYMASIGKDPGWAYCPQCFVEVGKAHHAGCTVEQCPYCGAGLATCGHAIDS